MPRRGHNSPVPTRTRPKQDNTGLKIGIIAGVVVVIVVLVAVLASGRRSAALRPGETTAGPDASSSTEEVRYDELGGMTMKEWCKANDKKNAELQARKQRMIDHKRGVR